MTAPSRVSQTSQGGSDLSSEAFAELYEQAYRTLIVVAIGQAGRADAEDIVQQAAIAAWQRRERCTPGTDFTAWMAAIVRGEARNKRRGERRLVKRHRARAAAPSFSPEQADPSDTLTEGNDPELQTALETLSEVQRTCFLLRSIDGRSYDQIGAILHLPSATARTHVFRARQRLAAQLSERQHPGAEGGGGNA